MRRVVGSALLALALLAIWPCARRVQDEVQSTTSGAASAPSPASTSDGTKRDRESSLAQGESTSQRAPLEAAAPADTRLAGRLLDEVTEEPVPWYALELAIYGPRVRVTSDAEGRFETPESLAAGRVQVRIFDDVPVARHQRKVVYLEHGPAMGPHELRIDVGPTYFVEVALPEGLLHTDLRSRLCLDPPDFDDDHKFPEALVREPRGAWTLPWLRFPEQVQGTPLWLELASEDGLWSGGARVPGGAGVHADPVRIELARRCAVRGRIVCPRCESPSGYLALLRAEDPAAPRWIHADRAGRFRSAGLAPGDYRLEVRNEALRGEPVTFALHAGELDLGDIPCTPIPLAGRVRVRLRSEVEVPLDVELVRRSDPPRSPLWHSDSWEPLPEGGFESVFAWDEVYAGTYEIGVHSHALGDWHVSLGELEPPVADLTLRLPSPPPPLRLDVVDAESGAPIADWTVLVREERSWEEPDEGRDSLAFMDLALTFAVCSPGYRAWVGNGALLPAPAGSDGQITVRLERGWSHLFLARRRGRGQPVANASIRLDGVEAGTTDARGELWVHAQSPAAHLEVSHPTLVWANAEEPALDELVTWIQLRP